MYRITASNPSGATYVIYDPVGAGPLPVLAPRITEELNEAGSLEFALVYGHPAFGQLNPKETYITVTLDGNELFYGRVLSAEPSPLGGQIQYTVAGALSFLQDGEMAPDPKNDDGSYAYQTMTAEAFFNRCINAFNNEIGNDSRRTFTVGIVNQRDRNKEREYQIGSYTGFSDVIRSNLIDRYGGFLRVRPKSGGGHYIDWVDQYGATDNAVLSIGQNILSITNRMNGEDFITAIRPIGKDGLVLSGSGTINILSDSQMARYGKIVRSVQLGAAETESDLREEAEALIDAMNKSLPITSEIGLVDLHFADSSQHGVNLGDVFTNIAGLNGERMTVAARNRDCENPQNDSCTLRNPKELEGSYDINDYKANKTTASGSDTLSRQTARAGGGAGMAYKYIHETDERLDLATKHIAINAEELELHADMFVETANEFVRLSHTVGTLESEIGEIEGTGVIQNSEFISQLAGQFQYDPVNHRVSLINGAELRVTHNGAQISVGKKIADLTEFQTSFEGSALWTQRNSITGIVGEFDIVTNAQGLRTLRVKSGGGLNILRNNVEYGVYDDGSLTAGVIVSKINGGTATIQANKIYLLGETIAETINADYISNTISNIATLYAKDITANTIRAGVNLYLPNGLSVNNGVWMVNLSQSGNTYTLKTTSLGGDETTVGTFSRATNLTGAWSGGTFTVNASPQGSSISTGLFSVASADITWNGNTASFPVYANLQGGETRYSTGKTLSVDATARYNAGVSASAPSGATLGTKITGTTWNVNIQRGGGYSAVGKTIDLASAYSDARSGYYTKSQYDANYTSGYNAGYKSGWNECIETAQNNYRATVLINYTTYGSGNKVSLYVAPTGGASVATGSAQIWRYGGSAVTRYSLPAKK